MITPTALPQLSDSVFLTDGGIETSLIFGEKIDLPCFASFILLKDEPGRETLRRYYRTYLAIARKREVGFILESPTWRSNPDWAEKLGYSRAELIAANRRAIGLMHELRDEFESPSTPIVISGCLGPRGDGYQPSALMTADEAAAYHALQIRTYRDAGADYVTGNTINYVEEALGIVRAASVLGIPSAISLTLETDGKLPTGQSLRDAIEMIDYGPGGPPAYYMINCAHPTHFMDILPVGESWLRRIRGVRANASCRSHAELDCAPDLDAGNPEELGAQYRALLERLENLTIFGGCCGTDHRHIESISDACFDHAECIH